MSALTDLRARITDPEGHLRDRGTIAAELERAIAEETQGAASLPTICGHCGGAGGFNDPLHLDGAVQCSVCNGAGYLPEQPEREVTASDLGRTFARLAAKQEARP